VELFFQSRNILDLIELFSFFLIIVFFSDFWRFTVPKSAFQSGKARGDAFQATDRDDVGEKPPALMIDRTSVGLGEP